MEWSRKKETFLNVLGTRLRSLSSSRNKTRNSYLSLNSQIRIPIILNTINVTQASTQTLPINFNNNAENDRSHKSSRRRKYQHRFNKCLTELIEKYPPIPPHDEYSNQKEDLILHDNDDSKKSCYSSLTNQKNDLIRSSSTSIDKTNQNISIKEIYSLDCQIDSCVSESIWSKLLESREDLSRLNKTLEYLDKRLERLSMNIDSKINICSKCKQKKFNSNDC